jgi:hypothetical protein
MTVKETVYPGFPNIAGFKASKSPASSSMTPINLHRTLVLPHKASSMRQAHSGVPYPAMA